jgi:hypothetical protein
LIAWALSVAVHLTLILASGGPYSPPTRVLPECPANLLYVNVMVWGLIQPSRMGGRYWTAQ